MKQKFSFHGPEPEITGVIWARTVCFADVWRRGNQWKCQPQSVFAVTNAGTFQKINTRRDDRGTGEMNLRVIGQKIDYHIKKCTSAFHAYLLITFKLCI